MNRRRRVEVLWMVLAWGAMLALGVLYATFLYLMALTHSPP